MIECSEESSIPDEQPGGSQSIEDTDDYASDLIHEARVAGWKLVWIRESDGIINHRMFHPK